jgi:ribosomal protein S18 acetylase RimI-like enzyme
MDALMRIGPLTPADRTEATPMLTAAFANDPLMHFLFSDAPVGVSGGIGALMDLAFETRSSRGWPVLGARTPRGELVGVAYLSVPSPAPALAGTAGPVEPDLLRSTRERFESVIGASALARYRNYEQAWTVGAPTRPHHYLGVLGVSPTFQGAGVGVTLLDAVAAIVDADANSEGVWLDTENPRNVGFYERRGFRVAAERSLESVTVWGMWRGRAGR